MEAGKWELAIGALGEAVFEPIAEGRSQWRERGEVPRV